MIGVVVVEWGVSWCMVLFETFDVVNEGTNGAPVQVAGAAKANQFTFDSIFLCCEFEGYVGDGVELGIGAQGRVQVAAVDEEMNIAKTES